jgi:hypothetical protein
MHNTEFIGSKAKGELTEAIKYLETLKGKTELTSDEAEQLQQIMYKASGIMKTGLKTAETQAKKLGSTLETAVVGGF